MEQALNTAVRTLDYVLYEQQNTDVLNSLNYNDDVEQTYLNNKCNIGIANTKEKEQEQKEYQRNKTSVARLDLKGQNTNKNSQSH